MQLLWRWSLYSTQRWRVLEINMAPIKRIGRIRNARKLNTDNKLPRNAFIKKMTLHAPLCDLYNWFWILVYWVINMKMHFVKSISNFYQLFSILPPDWFWYIPIWLKPESCFRRCFWYISRYGSDTSVLGVVSWWLFWTNSNQISFDVWLKLPS